MACIRNTIAAPRKKLSTASSGIQKQKALALAGRDAEQIQALTEYRPEVISRLIDKVRVFESGRIEIGLKSKYLTDIIGECIPELAS